MHNGLKTFCTIEDLKNLAGQIGMKVGKDINDLIGRINAQAEAINRLEARCQEIAEAHNQTAEIVDSLRLHLEFVQEKAGGGMVTPEGDFIETEEFRIWCAERIAKVRSASSGTVN